MRRLAAALAVCLLASGCGVRLPWDRVDLPITSLPVDLDSCHALTFVVELIADPKLGTRFRDVRDPGHAGAVYWPAGYAGSRIGSEVEVRDATDALVAVTGRQYLVSPANTPPGAPPEGLIASKGCIRPFVPEG